MSMIFTLKQKQERCSIETGWIALAQNLIECDGTFGGEK